MSFILDALRKSESERQRESAPSLSRAPLAQVRHRVPVWTWLVIVVLVAASLALGAAWFQSIELGSGDEAVTRLPTASEVAAVEPAATDAGAGSDAAIPPVTLPAASAGSRIRSINDLATFGPNLPDYRLELLAYNSAEPAASWARINGRRYEAGDRIGGGPEIVELRSDGVVLGYAGERFLLTAR